MPVPQILLFPTWIIYSLGQCQYPRSYYFLPKSSIALCNTGTPDPTISYLNHLIALGNASTPYFATCMSLPESSIALGNASTPDPAISPTMKVAAVAMVSPLPCGSWNNNLNQSPKLAYIIHQHREKGRDLTQSYGKSPYTHRKSKK